MIDCLPLFYIYLAALILLLPLEWILSVITASLVHELGHILAVFLFRGRISKITVSLWGCEIESCRLGDFQKLISIFAGPAASIALLLFRRRFPLIAVCGLLQGFYNLLPIHPLDGGRALRCGATLFMTESHARSFCAVVEKICLSAIILVSVYATTVLKLGISALFPAALILIHTKCGKIPCKRSPQRVQ